MIRLLELRTEKELSQRDMARILNISQGTYNNWENSNTQPAIEQLIALARFFDVSVDYLIGNSDDFGVVDSSKSQDKTKSFINLFVSASPRIQEAVLTILSELKNN